MPRASRTQPRKAAQQDRSRATVDAILRATARILVREGYDRASTNKIAEAAGVSIGSLYQYFPSKEALVAAVIDRHMSEMMEIIRDAFLRFGPLPLPEAVRGLVKVFMDAHRHEPKLHRVLVEQIPRVGTLEKIEAIDEEAMTLVQMYLEAHKDEIVVTNLELAAFVAVTSVEALTHLAVLRRPALIEDESFVEEVSTLVVRYLRGGEAPAAMIAAE